MRWLLRWASAGWSMETPTLGHSVSLTDEGGAPDMKGAAKAYLGLTGRKQLDQRVTKASGRPAFGMPPVPRVGAETKQAPLRGTLEPDDWERVACRRDDDGRYVTPMRAALSKIRNQKLRRFLHDLIPNTLRPSDITTVHGVPEWAEGWAIEGALEILYREYQAAPTPRRSWVDLSASQQNAETAA